ncbi:MAG: lysoplasmalogenase family protein [Defluviitaleaceae bacterium]|nr:lysoplasmalogenase family protein [Defluviitaleaceae bacterium]
MTIAFKFAFVAMCFFIALISFFRCNSKKDWAWLVSGLAFTLGADYFLVLHNNHLVGIAVFCFAHVCYIIRADKRKLFLIPLVAGLVFIAVWNGSVIMLAGIYAALFLVNLYVNFKFLQNKKTSIPKLNRALIFTGLCLFALCDVNVLIFNLPQYFNVDESLQAIFPLIWIFYLPSQALLAISALRLLDDKNIS